jgi:undecaprenyl diphosphate synthase
MSELQAAAPRPEVARVPRHVAIIMDGNHRWAKARGLPGAAGHRAGAKNVRPIAEACADAGVEYLTLFALSTENLERPKREVDLLLDLMRRFIEDNVDELRERGVRLRIIGDRSRFAAEMQMLMMRAEQTTRHNTRLHLTIAANYGGRWDITQAVNTWLAENPGATHIDEAGLDAHLALPFAPEPDLFIRTGGEQRISNFLLWQLAYAELYFADTLWPDFDAAALDTAIASYRKRERRFGRTSEQLGEEAGAAFVPLRTPTDA